MARDSLSVNVQLGGESRRLAVMHLEWERIRAVDLYVLLYSFLPTRGQIQRIAVFPSEFGCERMAQVT